MSRQSHSFNVEHAEKYGVDCAIVIQHLSFWIEQNQALGRNFHDGRTWMYQTQKEIAAIYTYWSEDVVCKILKKLEDYEVIIKGNYNKSKFDKTTWYAFKIQKMFTKPSNDGIDTDIPRDPLREMTEPIPYTKPYTKQKQQQASPVSVVVPSEKKNEKLTQPVYECLNIDELIDVDRKQKIYITKNFDHQRVIDALAYTYANIEKIETSFIQYLIMACKNRLKIEQKKPLGERNKEYAMKYNGKKNKYAEIECLSKHLEIRHLKSGYVESLEYDKNGFISNFQNVLSKYGFKILE